MNTAKRLYINLLSTVRYFAALSKDNLHAKEISSWKKALSLCEDSGYGNAHIFQATVNNTRKAINDDSLYIRDAVLFSRPQYNYPFLFYSLLTAHNSNGCLHVIDFGGSLGSSYLSFRPFSERISQLTWGIVEQKSYIQTGNALYQHDSSVTFYQDLDSIDDTYEINLVILSGVLMYLEEPLKLVNELIAKFPSSSFLIDRTLFLRDHTLKRKLVVQSISPKVFGARVSYPMWLLSQPELLSLFHGYDIQEFKSEVDPSGPTYEFKGFYITRKAHT